MGGSDDFPKSIRRYGCAGLIILNSLLAKNWLGLVSLPLLIGTFSLGYGESSWLMRKLKNPYLVRFVCGFLYALASLPILWQNWWLFGFHLCVTSLGVCLAGNQKFKFNDKREEFFIGLLVGLCPIV